MRASQGLAPGPGRQRSRRGSRAGAARSTARSTALATARATSLAALLAAGLAAGLVAAASPASAIEGGAPARAGDPVAQATVGLGTVTRPEDAYSLARCSGVLVRPDVVLTAAHCVRGDPVGAGVVFYRGSRPTGQYAPVADIRSYATQRGALLSHDVDVSLEDLSLDLAVLRLAAPVAGRAPLPLAADPSRVPASLTIAGTGLSLGARGGRTVGGLRVASLKPVAATSTGLTIARVVGGRVCSGDSGGPVVARGRGGVFVWGVASAVITHRPPCGDLVVVAPAAQVFAAGR